MYIYLENEFQNQNEFLMCMIIKCSLNYHGIRLKKWKKKKKSLFWVGCLKNQHISILFAFREKKN